MRAGVLAMVMALLGGATGGGCAAATPEGRLAAHDAAGPDLSASPHDAAVPDAGGDASSPADGEICGNGLDDNGNGLVDEGCQCTPGMTQRCYPGDPAAIDRGICRQGTQGCMGADEFGTWTECVGAVTPHADLCGDRLDSDCNGAPDDGPDCVCDPGESRPCYTGPAGTRGVGICTDGTQVCEAVAGVGWGACLDQVGPREEICGNGLDDDCNGAVDDGNACVCTAGATRACYSGPSAEIDVGICRAGTQQCEPGGTGWSPCVGEAGPTSEVCGDGVDNDCNGQTDDGCPVTATVTVDLAGDCMTAQCPAEAPYPVACDIHMGGDDNRGCVASSPNSPVVYFQEGDRCNGIKVTGTLTCSNAPGTGLNGSNCPINKSHPLYPADRTGCPPTH